MDLGCDNVTTRLGKDEQRSLNPGPATETPDSYCCNNTKVAGVSRKYHLSTGLLSVSFPADGYCETTSSLSSLAPLG